MQKQANIYINKIKKIYYIKTELKNILLKSIYKDKKINFLLKNYIKYLITKKKKKENKSFQKSVCLILSKHRSVYKYFSMKRHSIKKLNTFGKIPNLKVTGW